MILNYKSSGIIMEKRLTLDTDSDLPLNLAMLHLTFSIPTLMMKENMSAKLSMSLERTSLELSLDVRSFQLFNLRTKYQKE